MPRESKYAYKGKKFNLKIRAFVYIVVFVAVIIIFGAPYVRSLASG